MWCHLNKKNAEHFNLVEKLGLWARKMGYKVPRTLGTILGTYCNHVFFVCHIEISQINHGASWCHWRAFDEQGA
jgi:hypothetical protein